MQQVLSAVRYRLCDYDDRVDEGNGKMKMMTTMTLVVVKGVKVSVNQVTKASHRLFSHHRVGPSSKNNRLRPSCPFSRRSVCKITFSIMSFP